MRGRTALAASVVVTGLVVGAVVGARTWTPGEAPTAPRPAADADPTTLAAYDTTGVAIVRGPFCERVSPTGIEHALEGVPADSEAWDNGDLDRLPDGTRDRVQEFGCRWTAADGTRASAWVFVPPVTRGQARDLRKEPPAEGCSSYRGDDFGRSSAAWRCGGSEGSSEERYAGLFGDAWLTCSLTASGPADPELDVRTSAWCVSVLEAARG